jgi:hypothetical protein
VAFNPQQKPTKLTVSFLAPITLELVVANTTQKFNPKKLKEEITEYVSENLVGSHEFEVRGTTHLL